MPTTAYEFALWKKATVHIVYHVEVDGHYYSVPSQLVKKRLDIRITALMIECFDRGQRVASHQRSRDKGRHATVTEHKPTSHRRYQQWTPQRFLCWAGKIGPRTTQLTENILASRVHPQQAYRSLMGILRLGKSYGNDRLELACGRALAIGAVSFRSIDSILKNGLNKANEAEEAAHNPVVRISVALTIATRLSSKAAPC